MGFLRQHLDGHRLFRQGLVQAQFIANHHGGRVHHRADIVDEFLHEGIQPRLVDAHDAPPRALPPVQYRLRPLADTAEMAHGEAPSRGVADTCQPCQKAL
ncbi:hypothetical protein D9M70_546340 [compost metagenome]